ncbi:MULTISPECIES: hypothetical protein [unclassified Duganella]|uniref:hypothetical protein n=1 Tax=unclassified Duganella TaxID=2636909 RepID=UPI000E3555D5|nr:MULTISPECIES: hypothetical protein [unclassified Duganella]RFP11914.1 hypothetical protein D0T23_18260 [Duganella sp. BJB475]RFP30076.1 hypothetical protein D0T21_19720 [Duganella sp. BJB476]
MISPYKLAGHEARRYMLALALALLALLTALRPNINGDFVEYTLLASAFATHGTPEVRLSDIADLKRLAPERAAVYEVLEKDMLAGKHEVYAAFERGRGEQVYAVHFFGYPLLAAVPFKLLQWCGLPPLKSFQVINLGMVYILGLALFRLFGSARKAGAGVLLFMACGGVLYWTWTSPECLSAAALLAGLIYYASGAPLRGGLLGGLAALQNPTILFFFGFAPLIKLAIEYQAGAGLGANLRRQITARAALGLALGLGLLVLPPLWNLYQFHVPNIIVKKFSDAGLISLTRLVSFFFDLNQGMLIGLPAVLAALGLWAWRAPERRRAALVLAAAALFVLALSVPALAVLNWNSGAAGMMRYVFWSAMPLLFVLLWRASLVPHWPLRPLQALFALQLLCMVHAITYSYVKFSPLARLALALAPAHYHPEPEIFAERSGQNDDYINPADIYVYPREGQPIKWLYNQAQPGIEAHLCGPGMALADGNRITDSYRNWRYIDGALHCRSDGGPIQYGLTELRQGTPLKLSAGWSGVESGGGIWNGVWSTGAQSTITITLPAQLSVRQLSLQGHYFDGNTRSGVRVNGIDLGWVQLDQANTLALPAGAGADGQLRIELKHEAPHAPNSQDPRELAFFLQGVTLK